MGVILDPCWTKSPPSSFIGPIVCKPRYIRLRRCRRTDKDLPVAQYLTYSPGSWVYWSLVSFSGASCDSPGLLEWVLLILIECHLTQISFSILLFSFLVIRLLLTHWLFVGVILDPCWTKTPPSSFIGPIVCKIRYIRLRRCRRTDKDLPVAHYPIYSPGSWLIGRWCRSQALLVTLLDFWIESYWFWLSVTWRSFHFLFELSGSFLFLEFVCCWLIDCSVGVILDPCWTKSPPSSFIGPIVCKTRYIRLRRCRRTDKDLPVAQYLTYSPGSWLNWSLVSFSGASWESCHNSWESCHNVNNSTQHEEKSTLHSKEVTYQEIKTE